MVLLPRERTGLLVIDVQERLYPHIENGCGVLCKLKQIVQGFQILQLPIFLTEQYPKGLGRTIPQLLELGDFPVYSKTSFSALGDEEIRKELMNKGIDHWVVVGLESHVCVLQTAKELQQTGATVVVLNDAISSRSLFDYSTAIAELRDAHIRVSSVETLLFELVRDAKDPAFQPLKQLITSACQC